jgi:hypothetical protein
MRKKILVLGLSLVMVSGLLTGCEVDEGRQQEKEYQSNLIKQANDTVGMPEITNFYEKKMAKEILELRDDSNLICYAYTVNEMNGKYVYLGRCMGYGLPYSTQYTCPDSKIDGYEITLPQADPNGLYSSDSTAATWLYLINEETGKAQITYCEPNLVVSQAKISARLCEEWSLTKDYNK